MSWETFEQATINPNPDPIPAKTFTFELAMGTELDENNRLKCSATLVNDGEFSGRRIFFSYPDPQGESKRGISNAWSEKALVRLLNALGVDQEPGEDVVTLLNRAAGTRFIGVVKHKESEQYGVQAELNLNSVKPSA